MGTIIKNIRLTLVFISAIVAFTSCADEGCIEPVVAYAFGPLTANNETSPKINSFSVWGIGQEKDSVLIKNQTSLNDLNLLLNPNTETTDFKFEFIVGKDTIIDNVTFNYKNRAYFISIDCGCSTFFDLESIVTTGKFIKESQIVNSEITNEKKVNFNLYY